MTVLVSSDNILWAVGVGGVHDVEEDAVVLSRSLAVVAKVPDDELLAAVGEDGALNVVLEVGELSDKFETLLCKDAGHQETLDEKCEAAHCQ